MKGFSLMIIGMFVFSLFLFPFVIGEGSSTDTFDDSTNTTTTNRIAIVTDDGTSLDRAINATLERTERADRVLRILRNCDGLDERRDRITCRLKVSDREEFENQDISRIPEVCRALGDREACRTLYNAANHCYEIDNGRLKAKCFMRVSGFINSQINEEQVDRQGKTRKYLVYLLYELQERIEKKVDNGNLDVDTGASLIEQIVIIKEDLLNNKTRDVIKPKLQAFKQDFREAIQ